LKAKLVLHICFWIGWLIAVPFSFHPVPGSSLTKQFNQEWEISLDMLRLRVNHRGRMSELLPGFFMETEISQCVVVTDTYLGSSGGRPLALDREFNRISQDLDTRKGSDDWGKHHASHGTSHLESRTVQFRLVDDTYESSFERESDRPKQRLLDGLTEDMNLRMLVPSIPVAVGDSWEFELEALPDLLSPGGYMECNIDLDGDATQLRELLDLGLTGDLRALLGRSAEGTARVTYASSTAGLALLEIEIDVSVENDTDDLSALVERLLGSESGDWSVEIERLAINVELTATGTAVWDTRKGLIDSLELTGEIWSTVDLELCLDLTDPVVIEVTTSFTADFEHSVKAL